MAASCFIDKDVFVATTEGTPQGGICSPALANRTLDGLEALLHERFGATRRHRERHKVHLVRYADDFIITGISKELLRDEVVFSWESSRPRSDKKCAMRGCGNDPEKSLAAVSSLGSVREDLQKIADPDLQASLVHVSAQRPRQDGGSATHVTAIETATATGLRYRILRPHAKGGLGEVFVA
jgi:Reverse transcriptase (RNA-dependent DNA polymerase)